jgi:hypothetical protein
MQFNHGWTQMDTDTKPMQKSPDLPEGKLKLPSKIRVNQCASVVLPFAGISNSGI